MTEEPLHPHTSILVFQDKTEALKRIEKEKPYIDNGPYKTEQETLAAIKYGLRIGSSSFLMDISHPLSDELIAQIVQAAMFDIRWIITGLSQEDAAKIKANKLNDDDIRFF